MRRKVQRPGTRNNHRPKAKAKLNPLDLSRGAQKFVLTSERVIFEDDDLIAIDKPPGLPSQTTLDPRRHHLAAAALIYLQTQETDEALDGASTHKAYIGQHQRLDADTSGVIVFTKSKRANIGLAEQIKGHTVEKTYWAIASFPQKPKAHSWTIKNHLLMIKGRPSHMESVHSGGDFAETNFRILAWHNGIALVEARPRTGRMHQIRVHLSEPGHAILGDPIYAVDKIREKAPRLMLHAKSLALHHPITNEPLLLEAPLPEDFGRYHLPFAGHGALGI